jgi:hypothetical protein
MKYDVYKVTVLQNTKIKTENTPGCCATEYKFITLYRNTWKLAVCYLKLTDHNILHTTDTAYILMTTN